MRIKENVLIIIVYYILLWVGMVVWIRTDWNPIAEGGIFAGVAILPFVITHFIHWKYLRD